MLLRNILTKALWDARRSVLSWAVAIAAVGAMYGAFWPSVQSPEMVKALQAYPQGLLEALNYDDLTTAAGYLGGSVYGLLAPLLVAVFAIAAGTRAVAGDEDAGTLDLILAHPVSRARLALHRFAAVCVATVVISLALWLVMLALTGPAKFDGVSAGEFAAANLQLTLFGIGVGALAFAVGAASGRKALTLGASAGLVVLGYLANSVIPMADGLEWTRELSPFYWYLGGDPLSRGLDPRGCALLAATAAALVAAGTYAFTRRDVGV